MAMFAEAIRPIIKLRSRSSPRREGYRCCISLTDATPGDELILVNHEHHAFYSPYRMRLPFACARAERRSITLILCPSSCARARSPCALLRRWDDLPGIG